MRFLFTVVPLMLGTLAEIVEILAWLLAGGAVLLARRAFAQTSVSAAWSWAALAWIVWGTASLPKALPWRFPSDLDGMLSYFAAVLILCAPIAVLGARRPGARVWTVFILVPLISVLGWPALAQTSAVLRGNALQIETPAFLAFLLVTVMGLGNYVGTRFTLPAILVGAALVLVVAPLCPTAAAHFPEPKPSRFWATLCLGAAAVIAQRAARAEKRVPPSLNRVWVDFRDLFGIVWSKRLMERVNEAGTREKWPARLDLHGIEWSPDLAAEQRTWTEQRMEHTLRWLLRRFVDSPWIDRRLGRVASSEADDHRPLRSTPQSAQEDPLRHSVESAREGSDAYDE